MAKRFPIAWRRALFRQGHILLAAGLLAIWTLLKPGLAAPMLLPFWIVSAQLIFAGSFEAARLRRRAWLGQYLLTASPWHRWLRGGVLMALGHQLTATVLSLLLLVKLRLVPSVYWLILCTAIVLLVVSQKAIRRRVRRHVVADFVSALSRRLVIWPAGLLLMLLLVLTALWLPQPYLVGLGWEESLIRHISTAAGDSLLGMLERLGQALELTQYWAMQNALEWSGFGQGLALLGWLLLLLTHSAFAWAFIRVLIGADTLRDVVERTHDAESKDMS